MSSQIQEWNEAFNSRLKKQRFEQFGILLCDLEKCEARQKELLRKILFENCNSAQFWGEYIDYVVASFPDKKLQVQRLINRAIEAIDAGSIDVRDNKQYVAIHLHSANFKSDSNESLKYFQNIIWKREIGRRIAKVFLQWAEIAHKEKGKSVAIDILQKVNCLTLYT